MGICSSTPSKEEAVVNSPTKAAGAAAKGSPKAAKVEDVGIKIDDEPVIVKTPYVGKPTLYVLAVSANSHGCMTLAKANGIDLIVKELDVVKGETRTPEFMAKNPFHVCPTLESESGVVWESNAIMKLMCQKNNLDAWYPTDPQERAMIDMAMDWRVCNLYPAIAKSCYPGLGFGGDKALVKEGVTAVQEHLGMFAQYYIKDNAFIAGRAAPSIADLSVRPALEFLKVLPDFAFPEAVTAYMSRFDAAVACYADVVAPLSGYLAHLAKQEAERRAAVEEKKAKSMAAAAAKKAAAEEKKAAAAKPAEKAAEPKAAEPVAAEPAAEPAKTEEKAEGDANKATNSKKRRNRKKKGKN